MIDRHDVAYRRMRSGLSWATGVLLVGCVVGIGIATFTQDGPDRIGPLSEWVPGLLTAVTLAFTLVTQRRLDGRQLDLERRQAEQERAATDAARRHQAERVFVWLEIVQEEAVLRWSNVSEAPAYLCEATLILSDDTEERLNLGTMPPHHALGEVRLERWLPDRRPVTPADRFPKGVRCEFRDAQGLIWRRDPAGSLSLVEPDPGEAQAAAGR